MSLTTINQYSSPLSIEFLSFKETLDRSENYASNTIVLNENEKEFLKKKIANLKPISLDKEIQRLEKEKEALQFQAACRKDGKTPYMIACNILEKAKLEKEKMKQESTDVSKDRKRKLNKKIQLLEANMETEKAKDLYEKLQETKDALQKLYNQRSFEMKEKSRDAILNDLEEYVGSTRFKSIKSEAYAFLKAVTPFKISLKNATSKISSLSKKRKLELQKKIKIQNSLYSLGKYLPTNLTIDKNDYLNNRVSNAALTLIQKNPSCVELFMGNYEEMLRFYVDNSCKYIGKYEGTLSAYYYVFNNAKNEPFIVIQGCEGEEKIKHILLQHALLGVDTDQFILRGNVSYMNVEASYLSKHINWNPNMEKVLFIGNSRLVLDHLGYMNNPSLKKGDQNGYKDLKTKFINGSIPLEYAQVRILSPNQNRKIDMIVAALRMPNGSASGKYIKTLLNDHKINYIVMVGSGGSLGKSSIGNYEVTRTSNLGNQSFDLIRKKNQILSLPQTSFISTDQGKNITVDSILEEDKTWFQNAQSCQMTNCDVETAHIFKSFLDYDENLSGHTPKLIPGIFISDEVNKKGLEKVISAKTAYAHLGEFVQIAMTSIANDIVTKKQRTI